MSFAPTGSTVEDQLHLIFKVIGTPKRESLEGLVKMIEFDSYLFPRYKAENLQRRAPRLDAHGIELLQKFIR